MLLQRLPRGLDTGKEIHHSGIEVYLPLVDGIEFNVNNGSMLSEALENAVIVLPGDVHNHTLPYRASGHGPARVLIFGAYGFTRREKVVAGEGYNDEGLIPRFKLVSAYA